MRTPTEVRAIVERVVVEHGCGWTIRLWSPYQSEFEIVPCNDSHVTIFSLVKVRADRVWPVVYADGSESCARAVALWPEMQRLVAMLREALK
jgi:hypothetical protein